MLRRLGLETILIAWALAATVIPAAVQPEARRAPPREASLGAMAAYTLAAELEALCKSGDLTAAPATLTRLEHEIQRLTVLFAEPGWATRL